MNLTRLRNSVTRTGAVLKLIKITVKEILHNLLCLTFFASYADIIRAKVMRGPA
jgi:hypothetical protein